MSKSQTFERLRSRHAKLRLGRAIAHATVLTMGAIAAVSGSGLASSLGLGAEGSAFSVLAGLAAGAGVIGLGRTVIARVLKPIQVSADDFDAIEDELGGFDSQLLEVFQRCHGSRLMRDYDEFMDNTASYGGPSDFNIAVFYLESTGLEPSQMCSYDLDAVSQLVEANRLVSIRQRDSDKSGSDSELAFRYSTPPQSQGFLDRALERPIRFILTTSLAGSVLSMAATMLVHYTM